MKEEKPVRVVQFWKLKSPKEAALRKEFWRSRRTSHRMEGRYFAREQVETYCVQPRCRFRGKRAVQGVCFSTDPFVEGMNWDYFNAMQKAAFRYMEEVRSIYQKGGKDDYIRALEGSLKSDWINSILHHDEMISLRREVALLRLKLERTKKRRRR